MPLFIRPAQKKSHQSFYCGKPFKTTMQGIKDRHAATFVMPVPEPEPEPEPEPVPEPPLVEKKKRGRPKKVVETSK